MTTSTALLTDHYELTMLQVYGSLFFAAAKNLEEMLPAVDQTSHAVVAIGLRGKSEIGSTFITVLQRYAQALQAHDSSLMFVGVDPAVRNAAMKKLFTDPHYNVMDRLDTYIDDYSLSDPLPLSMLRKMASAQFLKLVDDEPDSPVPAVATGEPTTTTNTTTRQEDHAHTDLRLQPDHAPGEPGPGRGPGRTPRSGPSWTARG